MKQIVLQLVQKGIEIQSHILFQILYVGNFEYNNVGTDHFPQAGHRMIQVKINEIE